MSPRAILHAFDDFHTAQGAARQAGMQCRHLPARCSIAIGWSQDAIRMIGFGRLLAWIAGCP
jgi:hypothetical protein